VESVPFHLRGQVLTQAARLGGLGVLEAARGPKTWIEHQVSAALQHVIRLPWLPLASGGPTSRSEPSGSSSVEHERSEAARRFDTGITDAITHHVARRTATALTSSSPAAFLAGSASTGEGRVTAGRSSPPAHRGGARPGIGDRGRRRNLGIIR
jgi:hypothetical protein